MIFLKICKTCQHGVYSGPECDQDHNCIVKPSCMCLKCNKVLLMIDEPPVECPFILEQRLESQAIPQEVAERLS